MISVSALPLLAYKVGPNLFDLSSNLHQVSMRDQLHRAVALAEALVAGNQFRPGHQVLIVGAGVAGIGAGMVLAKYGIEVQIIDSSMSAPFDLQRGVDTRFIGPYMYEWPLSVYACQKMPPPPAAVLYPWSDGMSTTLPFEDSAPARPSDVVDSWEPILEQAIANSNGLLRLQVGIDRDSTNLQVKRWLQTERYISEKRRPRKKTRRVTIYGGSPWRVSREPYRPLVPRFVLLAAGMGSETNTIRDDKSNILLEGDRFWANDKIGEPSCGLPSPPRIVVIGGGDGAMQDALRAATIDANPLKTWDRLRAADANNLLPKALADIQVMETQHTLTNIWTEVHSIHSHELSILDSAYQSLAKELAQDKHLANAALASMRTDVQQVCLCIKESHFSKAYALNRFLVHILEQCRLAAHGVHGGAALNVIRKVTVKGVGDLGAAKELTLSNGDRLTAEVVIVRFGAAHSELPGQWLGLTAKDTMNRQELAKVPLPLYLPPSN